MNKICGYSCEHNKSGVCQISVCDKKSIISDKTEVQTLRLDKLDYTIIPNSDIKPLLDRLQQENERLKEEYNKIQKAYESTFSDYQQLKEVIDKAVEYIKENKHLNWYVESCYTDKLLQILEDKEVSE